MTTELLTPREVARRFKAPRDLVYEALAAGELKAIRRAGRWLVPDFRVEQWLREATEGGEAVNGSGNSNEPRPAARRE